MRLFLKFIGLLLLSYSVWVYAENDDFGTMTVYRSASCGCCGKWIKHVKDNGFTVEEVLVNDVNSIKEKYGIPKELSSCHTAIIDGVWIEGHVPADDIKRLLKLETKTDIKGISVPGMPVGTPGMDIGGRKDSYSVIALDKDNEIRVFNSYGDDE